MPLYNSISVFIYTTFSEADFGLLFHCEYDLWEHEQLLSSWSNSPCLPKCRLLTSVGGSAEGYIRHSPASQSRWVLHFHLSGLQFDAAKSLATNKLSKSKQANKNLPAKQKKKANMVKETSTSEVESFRWWNLYSKRQIKEEQTLTSKV